MPLYSYHCLPCDKDFELLMGFSETPVCPACGGSAMERQVSHVAPELKHKSYQKAMRQAAGREGHLSNYSSAERKL